MSTERYLSVTDPPPPSVDTHAELLACLERINTFNPPVQTCSTGWRFHGLYSGPTSIAFLFWRLSQLYPTFEFKSQLLVDWAHAYLLLGATYMINEPGRPPIDPDDCGVANERLAQIALGAIVHKDESLARRFCAFSHLINCPSSGSDEWLYGRSGYLYFLRLIRSAFTLRAHQSLITAINTTINTTISRILSSPRPWTWHHTPYIGAVHGSTGILTQILLSHPHPIPTDLTTRLTPIFTEILSLQDPSTGNFPTSLTSTSTPPPVVQCCHGGPAITHCLRLLLPYFPSLNTEINSASKKAQPLILSQGHLTKTRCPCYGIPSNALALTNDEEYDGMLRYMASEQTEGNERWMAKAGSNDESVGMWTGDVGRAWCWAILDKNDGNGEGAGERTRKKRLEYGLLGFSDV